MACQHFPDDQTLRLQAGAGEDDVIHLPSGLDRVDCERQEEEEPDRQAVASFSEAHIHETTNQPTTTGTAPEPNRQAVALFSEAHIHERLQCQRKVDA